MKKSSKVIAPLLVSTALAILAPEAKALDANNLRLHAMKRSANQDQQDSEDVKRGGFGDSFGDVAIIAAGIGLAVFASKAGG